MTTSTRLLLVGMDNPQSRDPRFALYPSPTGCAGHRLFSMMQYVEPLFTRHAFIHIPKTNLFPVGPGHRGDRREAGRILLRQILDVEWSAVLLGNEVADAVLPDLRKTTKMATWFRKTEWLPGAKVSWLPHPSGRNLEYNSKRLRERVGEFLLREIK